MTGSIGRLTSAPLVYALCQVRFSAVTAMQSYVEGPNGIQERLRKRFPIYRAGTVQNVRILPESGRPETVSAARWSFLDKERTTGFILNTDSLVIHTTDYRDFDAFSNDLAVALQILKDHVEVSLVERIGLRYVDQILPAEGDTLEKYVHPGIRGLDFDEVDTRDHQYRCESLCTTAIGQLVTRYYRARLPGLLPEDLMPLELSSKALAQPNDITGMLDIDHFMQGTIDFDVARIKEITNLLHDGTSAAFLAAVSNHALDV
ncbi:TIGR04255 family protein [Gammaproteobacteria bacterium]|nr:TIGR04255 family protein [Gammaproteobacteria bacterium]